MTVACLALAALGDDSYSSICKQSGVTQGAGWLSINDIAWGQAIDIKILQIDCLRFVMCLLLAPVFQGFFSFAATIYSTNEANKAGSMHR